MKFSLNWLCDFVEIDIPVSALVEKLTFAGFEVESVLAIGQVPQFIKVGKITSIEKHPNADKLVVTQVFDGVSTHQIVTGASNVFEGAVVPVSFPGAVLANGTVIKPAALRGVESHGMLCSQVELGIAEESAGIWILPDDTPLGVDVMDHFHLRDTVLDISILPNRGDVQSMMGLAREIAVLLQKPFKNPVVEIHESEASFAIPIHVLQPDMCPLYTARVIQNVTIKSSPFWLQRRLTVCGIRPINNVVDITNYVLLEYGQPLHAFDLTYLAGPEITVRTAKPKETIQTLDETVRTLTADSLLICDQDKPVALAGVMGGANSDIKDQTRDILLESAFFKPGCIRKMEVGLGLRTESSIRFDKGVDFEGVALASHRASYLIQELAGGNVCKGFSQFVDTQSPYYQKKEIEFFFEKINQFLGASFTLEQMKHVLVQLGFQFFDHDQKVLVPSWRKHDICEMPCLAEEISRMLGYHLIPNELPSQSQIVKAPTLSEELISKLRPLIQGLGYVELKTFPMISPQDLSFTDYQQTHVVLQNPLTPEESVMRPSLLPSGLKVLAYNYKRQMPNLKFFEIGKIFKPVMDPEKGASHIEEMALQILCTGAVLPSAFMPAEKADNTIDLRYLKGIAECIFGALSYRARTYQACQKTYLHPVQALEVVMDGVVVGEVGFLHPSVCSAYDITADVGYVSISLAALETLGRAKKQYQAYSKFPSIRRDIAFIAPKSLTYQEIEAVIHQQKSKLVKDFFLFDYFESEKIGVDKRSLAMGFVYQSDTETLTDEKVNSVHMGFCDRIKEKLPIEIR